MSSILPTLKNWEGFQWNKECEKAFQDLKEYLVRVPMSTARELREDLFIYHSVSEHAINAMLLRDQGVQQSIYYVSKTLVGAEMRYLPLEKVGISTSTCYTEVASLFPSSHHLCINLVSFAVIVEEIQLHGQNS